MHLSPREQEKLMSSLLRTSHGAAKSGLETELS